MGGREEGKEEAGGEGREEGHRERGEGGSLCLSL